VRRDRAQVSAAAYRHALTTSPQGAASPMPALGHEPTASRRAHLFRNALNSGRSRSAGRVMAWEWGLEWASCAKRYCPTNGADLA
jgi:hypothetical protein